MRLLILTVSLWALALAKPEMYKESEDFQYSRSSSDEGSKSGFYGAQRGNMGGNYEKAHNMDSMAQHHMSTLVRQIDGELGEGANTKTGSVFTAGNSRGIYGSGNYDLSNLKGRNFGENGGYDDSQSQSSLYQNARHQGTTYFTNNVGYGSEQSLSSKQRSGYSSSNLESQHSKSNLESENQYHGASNYDYGANGGTNRRYYSFDNSQARGAYDQSNTNLHSNYDLSNQNRLTSATPVKIYIRPGGRIALPVSAPTYTLYSSNLQDQKVSDTTNVASNSGSEFSYKPTNNAKHYESAYSYHKKWEKHNTQPLVVVPTENPFPANSELYEDRELDQTGQRYQSEFDSSNSHLSKANTEYSAQQNYQSGFAAANAQSSKANSAHSSGYSSNTKTASSSQARYQSEAQNEDASSNSNTYSLDTHNLGSSAANLNNLVEDINSRPKSYHSSFSYHKAWERRGDPYVITPSGDINGQKSQKLTSTTQNQGQFSSQQYGSHYNKKSHSNVDCDALCYQRRKRSYNINQYEQDLNNGDIDLGQQSEDGWDLGQQTENKFENLEDLGQATQNTWNNLENLDQHAQNQWNNLQTLGQETQNKWKSLENNLSQQTQNNWDDLTELSQQAQSKWSNQDDLGQQTENQRTPLENLGQEAQNQFTNIEDMGQQTQGEWSKLEDLGQQTQSQWGGLGHETQSKLDAPSEQTLSKVDNLGQDTLNEWDGLGQQTQSQWGDVEDLVQQTQTNWGKQQDFGQTHTGDQEDKAQTPTADNNNNNNNIIINRQENRIPNVESNEPVNHKFLWDIINQMYEEPPKTEKDDRILKNGESKNVLNHDIKQLFEIENLPTNKQSNFDQLSQFNENVQTISTTPNNKKQESISTDSLIDSKLKDVPDTQKHKNSPTNSFNTWQNQWSKLDQQSETQGSNLGQQSENQWSNLGQQSENQWSNLGQQSENQWSNLGQQSENEWSNLGQQSENQWSNLGQESKNEWSNLGQQSENEGSNLGQESETQGSELDHQRESQWSNLGQQSENQWSNLDQQSENQWSNLGQQSKNEWSNLGQQSENEWSNLGQQSDTQGSELDQQSESQWTSLGQQSETQWINLGQQTQNVWSHVDQQSQFTGGQKQYLDQDKRYAADKAKTEITHNVEDQNLKEFLEYYQQVHNWSHHSLSNKQNQPETTENGQENKKDLINGDSVHGGNHNVEHLSHGVDVSSSKIPDKTIVDLETTSSKSSTEVSRLPGINTDSANIGRGDIGADDDSSDFGAHIIDEQEKPKLIVYNLPSTTKKPINNEHREPYSNILINPTIYKIPVIEESTPEKLKTVTLLSQNSEEQNINLQQQFEQNLDLQQTQDELSVLPANLDYKSPSQNPSIQEVQKLETVPLQTIIQKHDEDLGSSIKKPIEIETPLEPTTEKTGFWSSIWNKTKNAKNSVVSWFKN